MIVGFRMPVMKKQEIRPGLTIIGYIHSMEGETPAASARSVESLEARITSIEDILCKKDRNLEILNELTRILPWGACLNTYVNRDGTIQLVGFDSSADVLWLLNKSPFFKDVVVTAPSGHDLFKIEAKLEK
jgi:hypothetical protein